MSLDLEGIAKKLKSLEALVTEGAAALAKDPAVQTAIKAAVDAAVADAAKVSPEVAELVELLPALKEMLADGQVGGRA